MIPDHIDNDEFFNSIENAGNKEQLLALAYEKEDEVFGSSERDEFDCLIALIEDGTIDTFEELAKYGVEQ